jgi:hypothetical protein
MVIASRPGAGKNGPYAAGQAGQSASSVNVRNSQSGQAAPVTRSPFRLIQATGMLCATAGVTSWK